MRHTIPWAAAALAALCVPILLHAVPAGAAVLVEGLYRISAPSPSAIPFRLLLTPTGAELATDQETLVFSYAEKSALLLDHRSRTYFVLPLELVPPLLAEGLGFDPGLVRAGPTGQTRKLLGQPCAEVLAVGSPAGSSLRTWRVTDSSWNAEYELLERAIGLPWTTGSGQVPRGIPLAGSLETQRRRPYRGAWEVGKITRQPKAQERFLAPDGYRMDLEGLVNLQGKKH